MKKSFINLMTLLVLFLETDAFAVTDIYECEGTPEIKSTYGDVLFWLKEDSAGHFSLSLDFGAVDTRTENAKCVPSTKVTGLLGVLNMDCTDDEGVVLPITFNRNDLTLQADFQFPGFGNLLIETTCKLQ